MNRISAPPARRAFVLVIDACGIGALPDAAAYGDTGANTLAHLADALGGLELPVLQALGLGSILALRGVPASADPAIHGRLHPLGPGKDSISGHWELMGVVAEHALPSYPNGFPPEIVSLLERASGHELICNRADNGLAAIEEFGAEHLRSGALILYTSQDSVLQLAAHVERVPVEELYRACAAARAVMTGAHAVGRVIARPFTGAEGAFSRTDGRRDYALTPPARSYLQELQDAGVEVHAVGKIDDLFAGVGVSVSHPGATNARALHALEGLVGELRRGLVFVNLIETDQVYGHRKDAEGFARALREIDAYLGGMLERMREADLLIVTADHGVDLAHPGTDHTREYAPLLAVSGAMLARQRAGARLGGARHDGPLADVGATALLWLAGREADGLPGEAFIS
jgi:phosphopentomutase